jgi:hypothetical protein
MKSLEPWIFRDLFTLEKKEKLPATTLHAALQKINISYIDWFKIDTQGTDLRLFRSVLPYLKSQILAVEFEPGIIDAYKGEDKLHMVMKEMYDNKYLLSSIKVQGAQRLHTDYANKIGPWMAKRIIRKTPGWAEVTYLYQSELSSPRDLLLLFIFALLERQYGFALEIITIASQKYSIGLFRDCEKAVWKKIVFEKGKAPLVILKRQFNKLFSDIND